MIKKNIGILASMSWNSNNWASTASKEDIDNSNYDYVKEKGEMHEDLNFAHEVLPTEDNGKFIAYTPMFNTYPSKEESKFVEIVFNIGIVNFNSSKFFNNSFNYCNIPNIIFPTIAFCINNIRMVNC